MHRPAHTDNLRAGKATSLLLGILVLVGLGAAALVVMNRPDQVVGPNEEIRYDDFGVMVTASRNESRIGTGAAAIAPRGTFCLVSIEVRNHAKGAGNHFDPSMAVLIDEQGREFNLNARAHALLIAEAGGDPFAGDIPAGQSCAAELVFDVPSDSQHLVLRLSFANAFTDFLDVIFSGRKRIRLPSGDSTPSR